jgi:hypothetical protein
MDETTETRLLLRIADLQSRLGRLHAAAHRLISGIDMPAHVTARSYSASDTKRVPARPLATLRNVVISLEQGDSGQ